MSTEAPAPTAHAADRPALPRSVVVWGAFLVASAVAVGILWAGSPNRRPDALRATSAVPERPVSSLAGATVSAAPRIAPRDTPMARGRWTAIVVYDSGSPAGDLASLERRHFDAGLSGLGWHFVIGNGQGLEDGRVAVGYRWDRQLPGAHASVGMRVAAGPAGGARRSMDAAELNRSAVAVCLVGNGDRRPFTERQLAELATLVRALQADLGIGAGSVHFHTELVPGGAPSGNFPLQAFRANLLP